MADISNAFDINWYVVCAQESFLEKLIRETDHLIDFMVFMLIIELRWLRHRLFLLLRGCFIRLKLGHLVDFRLLGDNLASLTAHHRPTSIRRGVALCLYAT